MNKKITFLVILVMLFTTTAFGINHNLPDFCNNGAFQCREISPNHVVAYPIKNKQPYDSEKVRSNFSANNVNGNTNENYYTYHSDQRRHIEVNLSELSWAAYDSDGNLVRSGPVSGGKDYCPDIGKACQTVTGTFTIYKKGDENCKSTRFPIGRGGAPMPYCMFFHGGYALHGSDFVPDYNASHGCIRMPFEDAKWLNENFVEEDETRIYVH